MKIYRRTDKIDDHYRVTEINSRCEYTYMLKTLTGRVIFKTTGHIKEFGWHTFADFLKWNDWWGEFKRVA